MFCEASFLTPGLPDWLQFQDSHQLSADPNEATSELTTLMGIMFLPPFLFGDISNLCKLDTASIYREVLTSINSWIASFDDQDNAAITNRQQVFKPLLQWLWAVHRHNLIPITPIQPSPGERERQWKVVTHQNHILGGNAPTNFQIPHSDCGPFSSNSTQRKLEQKNTRNQVGHDLTTNPN